MTTILVKLDDPRYGAGPATVVRVPCHSIPVDRDGAKIEGLRLWRGYEGIAVGDRVKLHP